MLPIIQGEFRAAADPELRFSPSGVAVGSVRAVAAKKKKNDSTGEWEDDKLCWIRVTCFKQLAENLVESISKGDSFVLVGKLSTEEWEDKDGNKRTSVEVVADFIGPSIAFATAKVTRAQRAGGGDGGGQPQQAAGADPWQTPAPAGAPEDPPF